LFHIFFYLLIGAVAIGAGVFLYRRTKRALTGGNSRQIRR
jgi:LPXTG-motif cell wall-anchored protein